MLLRFTPNPRFGLVVAGFTVVVFVVVAETDGDSDGLMFLRASKDR